MFSGCIELGQWLKMGYSRFDIIFLKLLNPNSVIHDFSLVSLSEYRNICDQKSTTLISF